MSPEPRGASFEARDAPVLPDIKRHRNESMYLFDEEEDEEARRRRRRREKAKKKASREPSMMEIMGREGPGAVRARKRQSPAPKEGPGLDSTLGRSPSRIFNAGLKSIKHRDRVFP